MKNKNGFSLGEGECPLPCNDGVACDWIWHWKQCSLYKQYKDRYEKEDADD